MEDPDRYVDAATNQYLIARGTGSLCLTVKKNGAFSCLLGDLSDFQRSTMHFIKSGNDHNARLRI